MGFGKSTKNKHSKIARTTMRAYHFRIETNANQFAQLHHTLDLACELKNKLIVTLENSRIQARAAKLKGETPSYLTSTQLQAQVSKANVDAKYLVLHSQLRQNLAHRVIEGQQRWFEALTESRHHVHPPSVMRRKDFRSFTFSQYGSAAKITNGKLHLSNIGGFRVLGWRKMRGAKKTITVKFKEGYFWAIVMCQIQESNQCRPFKELSGLPEAGIDPGLITVLTDSHGISYETPKPLKAAQKKLKHIQKDVSRKFKVRKKIHLENLNKARQEAISRGYSKAAQAPVANGLVESLRLIPYSNRLKANIQKLGKAHTKVERIRTDVARKNARKIETMYKRVAVEEHGLNFMMRNRKLAKACSDVAIGKQKKALESSLGKGRYFKTPTRSAEGGNSQTCLCGASVPKKLGERWHNCKECGLQGPRDQISAIIVQHTEFGSVPELSLDSQVINKLLNDKFIKESKQSVPGLGILEHAVKMLKIRRGEGKNGCGESRAVESLAASELSKKRSTQRVRKTRKSTGAKASVLVKTMGHANDVSSCPVETQILDKIKRNPNVSEEAIRGSLVYGGE